MQPVRVTIATVPLVSTEFSALARRIAVAPQGAAAMMVLALDAFALDEVQGSEMIRIASGEKSGKGPGSDARMLALVRTQIRKQPFLPRSYFDGAAPSNGYTPPGNPRVMAFTTNDYSGDEDSGLFKVFVACSGADSPRPVTCARKEGGVWVAREWSSLLLGVREPL